MVQGSSYANIALLVVSIRQGELQSGLLGQTIEHVVIARGMGIKNLIVAINKMDTVNWDMDQFAKSTEIIKKHIGRLGFPTVQYIPISAYTGENISSPLNTQIQFQDNSLLDVILSVKLSQKNPQKIDILGKPILKSKLMFYDIKTTGVVTSGADIKIHTSNEIYDAQIVKIFNGPFPFVAKSNYKGGFVNAILKLTDNNPPKSIFPNIILRNGENTIGIGKVQ
jgi:translation elongation factor EF-1alpha